MYILYGLDSEFAISDRRADVETTVIRDQKPKMTASQVNDPVRWRTERQRQPGKRGGKDSSCTSTAHSSHSQRTKATTALKCTT